MSSTKFDEITKALATPTSRRQAFKIFAGGVMAVAATAFGSSVAGAASTTPCGNGGVVCRASQKCCTLGGQNYCCHVNEACFARGVRCVRKS
jgi:hypothetical protein